MAGLGEPEDTKPLESPTDWSSQHDQDTHSLGAGSQVAWTSAHAHKNFMGVQNRQYQVDRNVAK